MQFDPSQLNDPIALQTEWKPIKFFSSYYSAHKLIKVNSTRLVFRATVCALIFSFLILLIGIGVHIIFVYLLFLSGGVSGTPSLYSLILYIIFGPVALFTGGYSLHYLTQLIVFDKRKGYFWKGWKAPDKILNKKTLKNYAQLGQIHALQLISYTVYDSEMSYISYELNLVLKDCNRIYVFSHGNKKKFLDDVNTLSRFLNKPIWDSTEEEKPIGIQLRLKKKPKN